MVIALSGKCCSGKNYISNLFKKSGFTIIDVDVISAKIFNDIPHKIIEIFGEGVARNSVINRKLVGDILFKDSIKRKALEDVIHPLVYKDILSTLDENKGRDYIINIPLLKQSILLDRLDSIVWIKSPLLLRIYRATKRDSYKFSTLFRRIITQKKLSVKYLKTTVDIYYIDNSWFSIGLEKNLNLILNNFQRGSNDR